MRPTLPGTALLCLLAIGPGAHAQFDALPDSNATWTTSFWIGPGYPYEGFFHRYDPLDPDTLIGGEVFKKLLETNNFGGPYPVGALRDNEVGQVYYCPEGGSPVLLYDFDVLPGDTIQDVMGLWVDDVKVHSVDTIVVNGTERKRIGIECLSSPGFAYSYWIQGIGGTGGLLMTTACPSVSGTGTLICMTANDTIQYGANVGDVGACDIYLQLSGNESPFELTIVPDPASGTFTITTAGAVMRRLSVYDAQGRQLSVTSDPSMRMGPFPPGLYLVVVTTDRGSTRVERIVVR